MTEIEKAIKHFDGLQKRYTTTHNGKHCELVKTAIAALREVQERQKGCVYCTDFEDLPEHIINGKSVGKVFDTSITCDENGRWHIELPSGNDIGISVCPYCGRRLTEGSAE